MKWYTLISTVYRPHKPKKNRKLFGQLQYQMKFALLLQTLSEYPRWEVVKICYFLIDIDTQNNKPFSIVEFQ